MSKTVRIIALIMAILLGISAIGMIAMYVSAETCDGVSVSAAFNAADTASRLTLARAAQFSSSFPQVF